MRTKARGPRRNLGVAGMRRNICCQAALETHFEGHLRTAAQASSRIDVKAETTIDSAFTATQDNCESLTTAINPPPSPSLHAILLLRGWAWGNCYKLQAEPQCLIS